MIVVTTSDVAGHTIVTSLGMVRGSTVRARHLGHDVLAVFRNLVGGEVNEYTKMLAEAREQALDRMVHDARSLNANAVVQARFSTCDIGMGAAEIVVYGTAVILDPPPEDAE